MKTSYLIAAALLTLAAARANTVKVYQTYSDPAQDELSFTYSASDLVGQYEWNWLDFTNWHPLGLDHFAVEITGFVTSNAPTNAFFMGGADSNGWFKFEIGNWGYQNYYDYDSYGNITLMNAAPFGELDYPSGVSPFRLTYQTSPYDLSQIFWGSPMGGPSFHSNLPYDGWGGDPHAIGYQVRMVSVADEAGTVSLLLLLGLAAAAGVARVRRSRSGIGLRH